MKRKKILISTSLLFLLLSGCNGGSSNNEQSGNLSINTSQSTTSGTGDNTSTDSSGGSTSSEVHAADKVYFHFKKDEVDFTTHALWVWGTNRNGKIYEVNGEDDFGSYLEMNPKEAIGEDYVKDGIYLLVRTKNSWSYQTTDTHIKYKDYIPTLNEQGQYELHVYFLLSNNKQELMVFKNLEETLRPKVMYAYLDTSLKKIVINADGPIETVSLYKLDNDFFYKEVNDYFPSFKQHLVHSQIETGGSNDAEIILEEDYELNCCYRIGCTFVEDNSYTSYYDAVLDKVFETTAFDKFVYEGDDLGATLNRDGEGNIISTTFKVWAPTSYYVGVNIYNYGFDSTQLDNASQLDKLLYDNISLKKKMTIDDTGVYSVTLDGDYSGKYYTYTIVNSIGTSETVDPYSYSSGINSKRSMIVDFENEKAKDEDFDALPLCWDGVDGYDIESSLDLSIYETHIRDLTMDDTWSSNPEDDELRGTFKGFIKRGTTYTSNDNVTVKTGFDHLEELGVNAIQLIPVFDQDNIEQHQHTTFNWGYNPQLYNVVEGSYSSDPFDGYCRIKEFKQLVAAFANNANHTRIIMDVVYNHVSSPSTNALSYTCPKYYFRLNDDGSYREGSGCGNEIRSEAPMMRKFIINSLKFWATEYKIKGFRFDLMGLIDCETLKLAKEELYKIDPDIVLYGEGWTGDGSYNTENAVTGSAYSKLYESDNSKGMVGAFNDCGRDAIRGGNGSWGETYTKPTHGFIAQGVEHFDSSKASKIADMMKGINSNAGANPEQTINYASCHDNFTLFDQLNWTLSEDGGVTEPDIEVVARASVAVNAMVFLSNGVAFMNGGEELFRSKILTDDDPDSPDNETTMYGKRISHNSYTYSDECNSYKYDRKAQLLEYFEMYKQVIALRKELVNAYYPKNMNESDQLINTWDVDDYDTAIATYRLGKDGSNYYIFFNGRSDSALIESTEHVEVLFNNATKINYNNGYNMSSKYQVVVMKGDK